MDQLPEVTTATTSAVPRYGLSEAATDALTLVLFALLGYIVLGRIPFLNQFGTHIAMAGAAVWLLRRSGIKVTWLPPRAKLARACLLTSLVAIPLVLFILATNHAAVMGAAAKDPAALREAAERFSSLPFLVIAAMYVKLAISVPVAEELAFRGYMHTRLLRSDERRWRLGRVSIPRAALISGALFSGIHLVNHLFGSVPAMGQVVGQLAYAFAFGVAAAWLLESTGALLWPVLLHAVVNVGGAVYQVWLTARIAARL